MRASFVSFAALLLVSGCSSVLGNKDAHEPGDPIGIYTVVAQVDPASTCAEAVAAAPKPWTFKVTLRRDKTTGFWLSGADPLVGTIDADGAITFHADTTTVVHDVEKAKGIGACAIVRSDDFTGAFVGAPSTATGIASFKGTLRYGYVVAPGADCRDVVGQPSELAPAPIFSTLPCDVHFTVNATKTGDAAK